MQDHRQQLGRRGEEIAAAFLIERGFHVLAKNWRCPAGEVDIIVERAGEVRFIEVKTRSNLKHGYPEESVTHTKRRHLARAVEYWLQSSPVTPQHYQIDVIAIMKRGDGQSPEIVWLEQVV